MTTTTAPVATTTDHTSAAAAPAPYTFLASNGAGAYTRWSPCEEPIRWQLDVTLAPTPAFREALAAALSTAAAATGHTFEYVFDAGSHACSRPSRP